MPNAYANSGQQLTVPRHFYKPPGSSRRYVRLGAPTDVAPDLPKKEREFRKSIEHAELKLAKLPGQRLITAKLQEWQSLLGIIDGSPRMCVPTVLTSELVRTICAARLYPWMACDDEARTSDSGMTDEKLAELDNSAS